MPSLCLAGQVIWSGTRRRALLDPSTPFRSPLLELLPPHFPVDVRCAWCRKRLRRCQTSVRVGGRVSAGGGAGETCLDSSGPPLTGGHGLRDLRRPHRSHFVKSTPP
ncbi:unnamed protein product [Merluccius merluccius]